jgi:hypothetical protein
MVRGGKREGAGAKLRAGSLRKNHSIKFTDAEWTILQEKAKSVEMTVSDYVRSAMVLHGEPKEGK